MTSLPDFLKPQEKHGANDKLTCHFCREEVKLSKMQNHVGGHDNVQSLLKMQKLKKWQHKNKMNCNRSEKILVDSVA